MATAKNVTVIPATLNLHTGTPKASNKKRRVAGYARVSTDSDEQFTSYEAQVDYYTNYIQSRPEWEFVEVYTDEGISALNTKRREGFKRMIADALNGKIDLIVTKSVSRFARNTVDSLTTVRDLKDKGVEVYFEKENIWTMDSKGEFLITIMSSIAQEESRSISENVTWGQRKRFADGKVSIPYKHFLGYKKGTDGLPEIVPEEAKIVRDIYRMFMEGMTTCAIANHLTKNEISTPSGKQKWQRQTVESILRNEKYKGSALLQKKYTVDFLQKKMKVNEGEVPQYYVEHSHPAIIVPEEWERVQLELNRRKDDNRRTLCNSPFAGKLICGDCGEILGSKVWHSNSKYRRTIWQCNAKFKGEKKCTTPHLYEDDIKRCFVTALSQLMTDREALLDDGRMIMRELKDTTAIDTECEELIQEMDVLTELIKKCVNDNTTQAIDQEEYISKYNSLVERHEKMQSRYDYLKKKKERRLQQFDRMSYFVFAVIELDELELQFNPALWHTTVDHVTVYADERLLFHFKNGSEVEVIL